MIQAVVTVLQTVASLMREIKRVKRRPLVLDLQHLIRAVKALLMKTVKKNDRNRQTSKQSRTERVTKKVPLMAAKTKWFFMDHLRKKKLVLMRSQVPTEWNQRQNPRSLRQALVLLARTRKANQQTTALRKCHCQQSLQPSLKTLN